jgi:DNA-binding NtrC family response regulator
MSTLFNLCILEDEPSERQLLTVLIQRNFPDWNLHIFSTSEQLLQHLIQTTHTPLQACLVLVDMQLPDSDGISVLTQVHALEGLSALPVVGFSNYSSRYDINTFLNQGATDFFAKPVELDLLVECLARLPSFVSE